MRRADDEPRSVCFVNERVIFSKFDVSGSRILISTSKGIRIFDLEGDKLDEINHPNFDKTGTVAYGSICYGNRLNVFIGGAMRPKFAPNCVLIMEQGPNHYLCVLTTDEGASPLINVLNLSRTIIFVTQDSIRVLNPRIEHHQLFHINTYKNPDGIVSASDPWNDRCILAFPAQVQGHVALLDTNKLYYSKPTSPQIIRAHENPIGCLCVSQDSNLLATASLKGTLIRVFSTISLEKVAEFRRGTTPAGIHCLRFSSNNEYLACSSDNGSIHVFALPDLSSDKTSPAREKKSLFGNMMDATRSIGVFTVFRHFKYDLAFGENGTLNVVGSDGTFRQYLFMDPKTKKTSFQPEPNTFDWILEFCRCDMQGPVYDAPGGSTMPKNPVLEDFQIENLKKNKKETK